MTIDLQVNMVVINPFDFFLESYAEQYPFEYEPWLQKELAPYLQTIPCGPLFEKYLKSVPSEKIHSITLITELNRRLQEDIQYAIRLEPGIQTPEETLTLKKGPAAILLGCWRCCFAAKVWQLVLRPVI